MAKIKKTFSLELIYANTSKTMHINNFYVSYKNPTAIFQFHFRAITHFLYLGNHPAGSVRQRGRCLIKQPFPGAPNTRHNLTEHFNI